MSAHHPDTDPVPGSPAPIVRERNPSVTALRVASMRAVHQLLDDPLVLPDPIALRLLGPADEEALRADPSVLDDRLSRGMRAAFVARSRFVEDRLAEGVEAGVRQYVLLGAGLDTFAYRNPFADRGLQVFEVDHAGTRRWKRQLLADAGIAIPSTVHYVPMDFESGDLVETLRLAGCRIDAPACISWMGVSMYLTDEAVLRTLAAMAAFAPGTCVCFDYRVPATMLDPIDRIAHDIIAAKVIELGEPWLSSFDPAVLRSRMLELGFGSAETVGADDLNPRYFAGRTDGLRLGGGTRIMCAVR